MTSTKIHPEQDPLDREYADAWIPKEGDRIRGTVLFLNQRTRNEAFGGGLYPIVTLAVTEGTEDGGDALAAGAERAVHVLHSVLENELAAIAPEIGDELGIRYDGKHERGYHKYRVCRYGDDVDAGGINWDKFGGHRPDESPVEKSGGNENPFDDELAATEQALASERDELDAAVVGSVPNAPLEESR